MACCKHVTVYKSGLIGNCQISALVTEAGSVDWLCLPRPDSEPVFGRLLDPEGGHFSVAFPDGAQVQCEQRYLENTNILITEMEDSDGARIRITDFCPRFGQYGRRFRPMYLFRVVEPIKGTPRIQVECKPVSGWNKEPAPFTRGNSHLRFTIRDEQLRLTTDMPLTYVADGSAFNLEKKHYLALTWGSAIQDDVEEVVERFLAQTRDYWLVWVKHCNIPPHFQKEVIRSALALKLHCYEDTGAILAALTTSLPEHPGDVRNWDYRFCWLRDAYFVLSAFRSLGHFEEMEGFIKFLLNIATLTEGSEARLSPVYSLSQKLPLPETIHSNWKGYGGTGPVRSFNQAAEHIQNDVYGEMVLTLAPVYFDERFTHLRSKQHEELLGHLGMACARTISLPDAGLWEVRDGWQEHTFSNLMCWAGLERIERIQKTGHLMHVPFNVSHERFRAEQAVLHAVKDGSVRNGPKDETLDASLSLLTLFRFPHREISSKTVEQIRQTLRLSGPDDGFFYRYLRKDDFGTPHSAFMICSFWIVQALAMEGRREEAAALLSNVISAANPLGLFSEHYLPSQKLQLGNFPQAYSHVGMINSAFAVSPAWGEIL